MYEGHNKVKVIYKTFEIRRERYSSKRGTVLRTKVHLCLDSIFRRLQIAERALNSVWRVAPSVDGELYSVAYIGKKTRCVTGIKPTQSWCECMQNLTRAYSRTFTDKLRPLQKYAAKRFHAPDCDPKRSTSLYTYRKLHAWRERSLIGLTDKNCENTALDMRTKCFQNPEILAKIRKHPENVDKKSAKCS